MRNAWPRRRLSAADCNLQQHRCRLLQRAHMLRIQYSQPMMMALRLLAVVLLAAGHATSQAAMPSFGRPMRSEFLMADNYTNMCAQSALYHCAARARPARWQEGVADTHCLRRRQEPGLFRHRPATRAGAAVRIPPRAGGATGPVVPRGLPALPRGGALVAGQVP